MSNRLIELRLKKECLKKRMDAIEAELDLVYHEIDEVMEESLDSVNPEITNTASSDGMHFNKEELHRLLCVLERSVLNKLSIPNDLDRMELIEYKDELSWDIAEKFGYDLNEGSIDTSDYTFKTFKQLEGR